MDFLIKFIAQVLAWCLHFVGWCLIEVLKLFLAGVSAIFNAIPIPDCFHAVSVAVPNLPPGVAYLIGTMHVSTGICVFVCAYLIRFVIRRIPFIG